MEACCLVRLESPSEPLQPENHVRVWQAAGGLAGKPSEADGSPHVWSRQNSAAWLPNHGVTVDVRCARVPRWDCEAQCLPC